MKVLDFERETGDSPLRLIETVDLTLCTRCRSPWGYEIVEKVEIWKCLQCGYEARERSTDFRRMLLAQQESMVS